LEETLRLIFQFTETASLSRAARVSRAWSNIALDELWRSLPSIFPLLGLLAPLEWILDATQHHRRLFSSLVNADWDRFSEYAIRIRCLNIDYAMEAELPLDSAALVHMFHRTGPVLPNIERISWRFIQNKNCTSIFPFLGPRLEHLALVMERGVQETEQILLIQSLVNFVPNLRSLRLISSIITHNMTSSLASFISSWPKLLHLELPAFFLTQEIVAATAQLPLLTKLSCSDWRNTSKTYNGSGMRFKFTPGSFTQLDTLCFAALAHEMVNVLRSADHLKEVLSQLVAVARRLVDLQL
ncbi:hypothetical protein FRC01_006351, partial [Tulasnella sp. 417]